MVYKYAVGCAENAKLSSMSVVFSCHESRQSCKVQPKRRSKGIVMNDESKLEGFYLPPASSTCTHTYWQFLYEYKEAIDLFSFMLHLAHRADDVALTAAKALIEAETDKEKRALLQNRIDNPDRAAKELHRFGQIN